MILREERIGGQRLILGDCLQVMPLIVTPSKTVWVSEREE